jgi:F1F0 ATPase subunit 2
VIEAISADWLFLVISLAAGFGFGLAYFWTLWLTVQRIPNASNPGLLMFGSYLVRTVVIVAAFVLIMDGRWPRMVALMIGFILARIVMVRREGNLAKK